MMATHLLIYLSSLLLSFTSISGNDYPKPPKTEELLFYIQRNHNSNTIVYDANFDKDGFLNAKEPILAYWIRYDEEGQKMDLRKIEKLYAYGVECKAIKNKNNTYSVKLVADKERTLILKQTKANKAHIYTKINGEITVLDHLYIQADNSGIWPKVEYIELFGHHPKKQTKSYEKIIIES